jgi:hypothetical protein
MVKVLMVLLDLVLTVVVEVLAELVVLLDLVIMVASEVTVVVTEAEEDVEVQEALVLVELAVEVL